MNRRLLLALLTAVLAFAATTGLVGGVRPALAAPADDRAKQVSLLEAQRGRLDAERRALEQQLAAKTAEVAALKKQRASWNRDQKLDQRLREAKDLAAALDKKAAMIRAVDARLASERAALVREADKELAAATAPAPARKAQLEKWRGDAKKRLGGPRRVEIADADADPLDDPEDLDEKAATLADSEQKLRAEEARLERRAGHYRKQAKLARAKQREKDQDVFDDEPRRGAGGSAGGRGDTAAEADDGPNGNFGGGGNGAASPPPAQPAPGELDDGTGGAPAADPQDLGGNPVVIYADVVDPGTLAELERAERSGDPASKAKAAERALKDVRARADRLKQKRLEMERRARELRGGGK